MHFPILLSRLTWNVNLKMETLLEKLKSLPTLYGVGDKKNDDDAIAN